MEQAAVPTCSVLSRSWPIGELLCRQGRMQVVPPRTSVSWRPAVWRPVLYDTARQTFARPRVRCEDMTERGDRLDRAVGILIVVIALAVFALLVWWGSTPR